MRHLLMLLGMLLCLPRVPDAMEFRLVPGESGLTLILAAGPIELGDEARFARLVGDLGSRMVLVVDSPGGNIRAANAMRAQVAGLRMPVVVPPDAQCASACFLLFVAAERRLVARTARVGVHGASLAGQETTGALAHTTLLARVAAEYGVPDSIVARMVTTSPREMWWLTEADLLSIRNTRVVEPDARDAPSVAPRRPDPQVPDRYAALPSVAAPSSAAGLGTPRPSPSGVAAPTGETAFVRGQGDRLAMEAWIAQQPANIRAGIDSWAMRRSQPNPGTCANADPGFSYGCAEAQRRLAAVDAQRRGDPEYRRGWNTR